MRVACCQLDIAWEDKAENYRRAFRLAQAARVPAGALVLLPEMFATGFSMNADAIAETLGGGTSRFLADLAVGLGSHVVGGAVMADGATPRPRNEALLFGPSGTRVARYAKVHRFSFAGEDQHYSPGDTPVACDVGGVKVQLAVCYDLRFPELFRSPAVRGAEIICVIANWPAARDAHWMALLKARAIENQAYVAAVNRCGRDPNVEYSGRSQIISPMGEVLADARGDETVIQADLDLEQLRAYRRKFPALDDVRL